ncbi:excisionase family DNA-binding protein [Streptomyces sp. NPDC005892]|uniref:excisionase family DNA-binding protein n=1 Tax=Streptomyces sp. NPDC005892 TaxID=3155593 RepID=UPI0033EC1516
MADRLLGVAQAAEHLGVGERFIRRLVSERRIRFVKVGKHVRIADTVLDAYVAARTVEPVGTRRSGSRAAA